MTPKTNQDYLNKEILTTAEACKFLGLSKSYLYKLTHQRKIVHYKPGGKQNYFKVIDLEAYLLRNRIKPDSELQQEAEEKLRNLRRQ